MTERKVFLEALEMATPEARAAYLEGVCGGNVTFRRKVEELLKEHFANDSLLAGLPLEAGRSEVESQQAPAAMLGRYKLLEKIGEGGFGEVWMAEQREPVKRRVALKILKPGMDSRQIVARFEAERQALAMMDHANIAKIFDAGTTDSGRPYFVMELVRGIKITDYCDQKQLLTEERLKLFILVCHAIQHAHQKGIIHRDIKPSNILVTLHDGVPVPKVIDFGIAKATQQELTDKTLFTQFQQFIGTPAYISPEQAEMSGLDIDTRADIYSLGVLLYELLVGQTPFDPKEMVQGGLDALRQIIREKEPLRPSTKLNTLQGDARTTAGKRRQTDVGRLVHQLQGDLDWIVMKCLEKDRARRYDTANSLASDIERHMNNEPVLARPPSKLYEFQKTVRRHKVGFAAAGAVVLALAIGLGIATWTLVKEQEARQRAVAAEQEQAHLRQKAEANEQKAETAAASSAQVARFLEDMLNGVGPSVAQGSDTKLLREILDKTAERAGKDLTNQPLVEAELRSTLGGVYLQLREHDRAEAMAREALRLRKSLLSETNELVAASLNDLAYVLLNRGKLTDMAEAETLIGQALAVRKKRLGENNPDVATSLSLLATALVQQNKLPEAEAMHREALLIRRKLFGNEHRSVASSLDRLTLVLRRERKYAEAESAVREALAIQRKLFGNEDPDVATSLSYLSPVLVALDKRAQAESTYREALELFRKLKHPDFITCAHDLVVLLHKEGKLAEAEDIARESLAFQRKLFGDAHIESDAVMLNELGDILLRRGKFADAESAYREALGLWKKIFPADDSHVLLSINHLVDALVKQSKLAEAESLVREALEIQRKLPAKQRNLGDSAYRLSKIFQSKGQMKERMELLGEAADAGSTGAQNDLAWSYEHGINGLPKDPLEAVKLYQKAAAIGNAYSLESLGRMYRSGDGVMKDPQKAVDLYRQSAEHGNVEAQVILAEMLTAGEGGPRDMLKATDLYRKAANSGNTLAQIRLIDLLIQQGNLGEADALREKVKSHCRELISRKEELLSKHDRAIEKALGDYGRILEGEGKLNDAEMIWREELEVERQLSGKEHPFVANSLDDLGRVLVKQGKLKDAEATYNEALAMRRKFSDKERLSMAYSLEELGRLLVKEGKLKDAEAAFEEALVIQRDELVRLRGKLSAEDPELAAFLSTFVHLLLAQKQFAQAEALARESLAIREKKIPDDWRTFNSRSLLGGSLLGQKKYAEAESFLLSGYEGMKQREKSIPDVGKMRIPEAIQRLAELYEATGQPGKVAEWKKLLEFDQAMAEK